MNFTLKEQLKKDFFELAKKMETTPSNLLNMLMKNAVITKTINISIPQKNDWEIENVDISDWSNEFKQNTENNTKELKKLIAKGKI